MLSKARLQRDSHFSILRPTTAGALVTFSGRLLRRGKNVAFMEADVHANDKLVARCTLTKAIIPVARRYDRPAE